MRWALLAVTVLASCSAVPTGVRATSWDGTTECQEAGEYGGGLWSHEFGCRDGRGVLVWAVWIF